MAFADFNWIVDSGFWDVGSNWNTGYKPDSSQTTTINRSGAVSTLNTDEGLLTSRLVIQGGQTLNIENGGRIGYAWSRTGRNSQATVNMSGNGAFVCNNDDLYIGVDIGGNCVWTMSDTSSITVNDSGGNLGDNIYVAQNDASGTLRLIGSQVTVHANEVLFSDAKTGLTSPVSTLEFVMDAGGASRVISDVYTYILNGTLGPNAAAHLVVSSTAPLAAQDIVLIECLGTSSIRGAGTFTTLNGGSAAEGSLVVVGGNLYALTYQYDAGGGSLNDVALVFVRSAKNMATNPVPADKSTVSNSPLTLSWTNPDPNDGVSPVSCDVYFGMDPNRPEMDMVSLGAGISSVDINATNFPTYGTQPLVDANDFYWVVDCHDPSAAPGSGDGLYWSFSTDYNIAPVVDAGPDQVAWLGMSGTAGQEVISLSGAVSDDGKPNPPGTVTLLWTQVSGPATVTPSPDNTASTSVTITVAGVYEFMLTADDSDKQTSDTVEIIVGTDSCEASILSGSYYNSKDFNQDCVVDMLDFADFTSDWLACTNTLEACY